MLGIGSILTMESFDRTVSQIAIAWLASAPPVFNVSVDIDVSYSYLI